MKLLRFRFWSGMGNSNLGIPDLKLQFTGISVKLLCFRYRSGMKIPIKTKTGFGEVFRFFEAEINNWQFKILVKLLRFRYRPGMEIPEWDSIPDLEIPEWEIPEWEIPD